jgi:hypothetical protein
MRKFVMFVHATCPMAIRFVDHVPAFREVACIAHFLIRKQLRLEEKPTTTTPRVRRVVCMKHKAIVYPA